MAAPEFSQQSKQDEPQGGGSLTLEGSGSSLLGRSPGPAGGVGDSGLSGRASQLVPDSDESRLPLSPQEQQHEVEASKDAEGHDTFHIVTGQAGSSPGDSSAGSKSGTNVDSMLGRLVVEMGLATVEELTEAQKKARPAGDTDDPNQRSLADVLVDLPATSCTK